MIRRLWLAFAAVVLLSFAVLGWTGIRIYQQAPPVPVPGMGLTLFCLRALDPVVEWREGLVKFGFWAINIVCS